MAKRSALNLSPEIREELTRISQSRSEAMAMVQRAKILLHYSSGKRITDITIEIGTSRPLVERCIDKALAFGPIQALKDLPRSGHPTKITEMRKPGSYQLHVTNLRILVMLLKHGHTV